MRNGAMNHIDPRCDPHKEKEGTGRGRRVANLFHRPPMDPADMDYRGTHFHMTGKNRFLLEMGDRRTIVVKYLGVHMYPSSLKRLPGLCSTLYFQQFRRTNSHILCIVADCGSGAENNELKYFYNDRT